jgi:carboxymethylenebutenolidase
MHRMLIALSAVVLIAPAARADEEPPHQHGDAAAADTKDDKVPTGEKHNLDTSKPELKGEMVTMKVGEEPAQAYVARAQGKQRGAILVIHEWWGLNDWIKHQADLLGEQGYLALAVDLYKGKVATDPKEAGELMGKLDQNWADRVKESGIEWLKKEGSVPGVATIGWCMGGGQSLRASLRDPKDVVATVMYYGMPVDDVAQLKKLQGPVLGIWADKDGWITPDKVKAFGKALTQAKVKHEFHHFDADHAFANPSNGPKYSSKDAQVAWEKTLAFLEKNLGAK